MIEPGRIQLTKARDGLYETFYCRGNSEDGRHAFWLKHNLLRRHGERRVLLEVTVVLFDRTTGETTALQDKEELSPVAFAALVRGKTWDSMSANMASGSFFEIQADLLQGKLFAAESLASWSFQLTRSNDVFFHFPHSRLYQLPLPKKKVLTRDTQVLFNGTISIADKEFKGSFKGTMGHNWGTEHAHEYAYASCNAFQEDGDAYFDGFTARLALAAGILKTPRLSMAALRYQGQWYYFNALSRSYQQSVSALTDYQWAVTFKNDTHALQVEINGSNPRLEPWVALHYEHPGGARSVAKNTKFATGRVQLFEQGSETPLADLRSDCFELETLLSDNEPLSQSFQGEA